MRRSRARYVTVCQQSLVTAVVVAVAASAAGVRTLDIVPSPSTSAPAALPQAVQQPQQTQRQTPQQEAEQEAVVSTVPTKPTVREVGLEAPRTAARPERTASPQPTASPEPDAGDRRAPTQTQAPTPSATPTIDGRRVVAQSEPTAVEGFATVGLTWDDTRAEEYDEDEIAVEVRTRTDGTWTAWAPVEYHDDHGPDADEATASAERAGTEPVVVGDVDEVQARAATADGSAPRDLSLAVVDPGDAGSATEQPELAPDPAADVAAEGAAGEQADDTAGDQADDTVVLNAARRSAKPAIFSRAQWGADERLRSGSPSYGTIKTGFIHHTVNANNYSEASVPSLIRGIYAYHTQARGWSDIGYNFLVDRFGRIWEGRYGGVDRAVVGAHTSGYNSSSFAMSAIGNFDVVAPPQAVVDAYSRLFAWKLSVAGIKANATGIRLGSRTFQAINGHRDAGSTACPGRYLYAKLGAIRTAALRLQTTATTPPAPAPDPEPAPVTDPPKAKLTSPLQRPGTWTRQRAGIAMPKARSLMGSAAPELLVKQPDGRVDVLPTSPGLTGFGGAVRSAGDWSRTNLLAAVGDLDGDGRGDVVARDKGGAARWHRGLGDGRVAASGTTLKPTFAGALSLAGAGDWNRDGRADLLVRNASSQLVVWFGKGSGQFRRGPVLAASWRQGKALVAGDLDGDGRPEVVGATKGRVDVFRTTPTRLGSRLSSRTPSGTSAAVAAAPGTAADLSGDGVGDVVTSTSAGVRIHPGARRATLEAPIGPLTAPSGLRLAGLGQLAGSAHADLVGVVGRSLVVAVHNGAATLGVPVATGLKIPGAQQLLSVGDWNGDGNGDLVTRENNGMYVGGRLVLRLGNGRGGFGAPTTMSNGWRPVKQLAAVGDVTGDGHPDLAGVLPSGATVVYPGDGARTTYAPVTAPTSLLTFGTVGTGAWQTSVAARRLAAKDGSFVPAGSGVVLPTGYDQLAGPGDVDGDGRADVVALQKTSGRVYLLRGTSGALAAPLFLGQAFPGALLGG